MKYRFLFWAKVNLIIVLAVLFLLVGSGLSSALPYRSYFYNYWGEGVPSPAPYVPDRVLDGQKLGVGAFSSPRDVFVDYRDYVYIVDTGNQRIVGLDNQWQVFTEIDHYIDDEGEKRNFQSPRGVHVTEDDEIFVADRDAEQIFVLNQQQELVRTIEDPRREVDLEGTIPEGFIFRPVDVGVSQLGKIYVLSEDNYEGILEFEADGTFSGFFGAPEVRPDPVDLFWRYVGTEAQRQRRALFLPTLYSGMDIDHRGFIYVTVSHGEIRHEEAIRMLNPEGTDRLRRQGFFNPVGDINYPSAALNPTYHGPSTLVDITTRGTGDGIYTALDRKRGRLFTYDNNGNLLYVFGTKSDQEGAFRTPSAVEYHQDDLIVVDRQTNTATVFAPTEFSEQVLAALNLYNQGYYEESEQAWREVLRLNANYELAYTGIGLAHLFREEMEAAMTNFRRGSNRSAFSEAFAEYRSDIIAANFGRAMMMFLGIIILVVLFVKLRLVDRLQSSLALRFEDRSFSWWQEKIIEYAGYFKYALFLIFHPFSAFWDLKNENRGNAVTGTVILLGCSFTYIFVRQFTGFIFNPYDLTRLNVIFELSTIIVPVLLWSVSNWSLTTLMEGKGTFKEIYTATTYSLTPIIIIYIPLTVISNYLTLNEEPFYNLLLVLGVLWALMLIFVGNMITHDFLLLNSLMTAIASIVGMGVIIFLALLFVSVVQQMWGFIDSIYSEYMLRL